LTVQVVLIALISAGGLFYFARALLVGERHPAFGAYLILGISGITCGAAGCLAIINPVLEACDADSYRGEQNGRQQPSLQSNLFVVAPIAI
jgi:hypothetical protein